VRYYIGTGALSGMYTLRVTWTEKNKSWDGEVYESTHDQYQCNLATDWDRAVAKAQAMVDKHDDAHLDLNAFDLEHLTAPEYTGPKPMSQEERDEMDEVYRAGKYAMIEEGLWPFGQFYGEKFDYANSGYIIYMARLEAEEGKNGAVMKTLQAALHAKFPELLAPTPEPNGKYFGEIGKRYHFEATVVESFSFDSFYGRQYIVKMVSESGELIVYKGGSSNLSYDVNTKVGFDAGVKEHSEYDDQNQTMIQRPTKIEALNQEAA